MHGAPSRGVLFGLAAAVSFGMSAPLAKTLLSDVRPQMLAALLYLGAFWALTLVRRPPRPEAPLRRSDAPRLVVVIVAGGIVAPVLLLLGLERVSGISGSLLLNLEGPLTILLGVTLFREHLSRQAALGSVVVFSGALLLGAEAGGVGTDWLGVILIAGACVAWSLDNNVTQSLTVRDPRSIVRIKAGCAGVVNLGIAVLLGQGAPAVGVLAGALMLGGLSYGLSVYWDVLALRALDAYAANTPLNAADPSGLCAVLTQAKDLCYQLRKMWQAVDGFSMIVDPINGGQVSWQNAPNRPLRFKASTLSIGGGSLTISDKLTGYTKSKGVSGLGGEETFTVKPYGLYPPSHRSIDFEASSLQFANPELRETAGIPFVLNILIEMRIEVLRVVQCPTVYGPPAPGTGRS